jgi:hypothetical protein
LDLLGLYGRYNIKLWPLGGDIMDKADLSIFAEKHNIIALLDTDTKSDPIRRKFIRLCDEKGINSRCRCACGAQPAMKMMRRGMLDSGHPTAAQDLFSPEVTISLAHR